jgi:Tol biopolymer transport system component
MAQKQRDAMRRRIPGSISGCWILRAASGRTSHSGRVQDPTSWSRDGRFLLFYTALVPKTHSDIWVLSLESYKPTLLAGTDLTESFPAFSPDGRWVAYTSDESGQREVYLCPFIDSGPSLGDGKWQVSRDGALRAIPRWRGDGKELVFAGSGNSVMGVDVVNVKVHIAQADETQSEGPSPG